MKKQIPSSKRPNWLKLLIVIILIAVLLIAGVVTVMMLNKPKQSPNGRKKIIELLMQNSEQAKRQQVSSDFGFTVPYDPAQMDAEGIVQNRDSAPGSFQGKTYSGDELKEKRGYGIITLRLKSQPLLNTDSQNQLLKTRSYFTIVANRNKNYFGQKDTIEEYKNKSNLDVLTIEKRKSLTSANPNDEITERTVNISGKEYRELKVAHRTKVLNGQFMTLRHSYYYLTVQNDRPYWLSVYDIQGHNKDELSMWQGVIAATTYTPPNNDALTKHRSFAQLAEAKAPTDTANIRDSISDDIMVNVVARNQLATVRIGAGRCADLTFRANGYTLTLANTCMFGIGSGSIVSGDGLVATNGHVTKMADKDLARHAWPRNQSEWDAYYQFVVGAGYTTREELRALINESSRSDKEVIEKLSGYLELAAKGGVGIANDRTDYVVQTSDEPIRLKDRGWTKTATNKAAKLIDQEVGPEDSLSVRSTYTDVALLKMDGTFPTIQKMSSLNAVQKGDAMTAIGYPAVVDGGPHTTKQRTVPTVTYGHATGEMYDAGGHKLMVMSTQIASGNSGGPAFNKRGEQVGLNTYGAGCPDRDDGDCFGRGIARDGKDIHAMAEKNRVRIDTSGELAQLWQKGLDNFVAGRYKRAAESFTELNSKYPNNYIVKKFLETAEKQPRDETDQTDERPSTIDDGDQGIGGGDLRIPPLTKSSNSSALTAVVVVTVIVIVLCIAGVITAVVIVRSRQKNSKISHTASPTPYPVNPVMPPQQPSTSWAPQQSQSQASSSTPVSPATPPQQYLQQPAVPPSVSTIPMPAAHPPTTPATPQPVITPAPWLQPSMQQVQTPMPPMPAPPSPQIPQQQSPQPYQQPRFQGPPDKTN